LEFARFFSTQEAVFKYHEPALIQCNSFVDYEGRWGNVSLLTGMHPPDCIDGINGWRNTVPSGLLRPDPVMANQKVLMIIVDGLRSDFAYSHPQMLELLADMGDDAHNWTMRIQLPT
jgi:hypothetical protein